MKINKTCQQIEVRIFNQLLKETMDLLELPNRELAELTGKHTNTVSRIRNAKTYPNLNEFVQILNQAEKLRPGFIKLFAKMFVDCVQNDDSQQLLEKLDSVKLGILLIEAGERLCKNVSFAQSEQHCL